MTLIKDEQKLQRQLPTDESGRLFESSLDFDLAVIENFISRANSKFERLSRSGFAIRESAIFNINFEISDLEKIEIGKLIAFVKTYNKALIKEADHQNPDWRNFQELVVDERKIAAINLDNRIKDVDDVKISQTIMIGDTGQRGIATSQLFKYLHLCNNLISSIETYIPQRGESVVPYARSVGQLLEIAKSRTTLIW